MRDWGRLRHKDRSLWWTILARNKRSVALNLREPEGQEIAKQLADGADIILENFRPGTMEKWGLGPEDIHARNPKRHLRPRLRLRPDRPLRAPPRLRLRRRGDQRPQTHQRLPRPGAAALRHQPRRHARRAIRLPGHPARADRAQQRRRGPGRGRRDRRRLLRDERVEHARVREDGLHPRADRPAAPAHRAEQRLPEQRQEVGRDRGQPRHAVAPAGGDHGQAGAGGGRALRHPPRARRARGPARRDHRRLRRQAHGGGARRDRQRRRRRVRPRLHGRRTSTRTRTSASASCSWRWRTRCTGRSPCPESCPS